MVSQNLPKSPVFGEVKLDKNAQATTLKELTDVQLRAIEMLVGGAKLIDVSEDLGIDRRTLYCWRKEDPRFIEEYDRRRTALYEYGLDRFRNLTWLALDRLEIQIREADHAPTAYKAARAMVTMARLGQVVSVAAYEEARSAGRAATTAESATAASTNAPASAATHESPAQNH